MGFALLPLAAFAFFMSIVFSERNHAQNILPAPAITQASVSGQMFIAYRNAVALYQQNNPTFIGSAPITASPTNQFSATFLAVAGNNITATASGTGRVITTYAALPAGAITTALALTQNDASLGLANGTTWTSYAQGVNTTPITLSTAVPNGDVVSVVQIGI